MRILGKKRILVFFAVLMGIYTAWLVFHLLRFKSYTSYPVDSSLSEIVGVYHVHSSFSDGGKSPNKIAKDAARASLDFFILTDHGNPNFRSLASNGWKENVLALSGSELSVNRGHLVALGFDTPSSPFSQNAEEAAHQVRSLKGFSVIAHPYSKTHWSWGRLADYSGIEIINADGMLKRNYFRILPYLPALPLKPKMVLLKLLDFPERNFRKWDNLNQTHHIYGYFSSDAHLLYRPLFHLLRLHLLLEQPLSRDFDQAKAQVLLALKQGRFFNAVDAAARANGFRFWGEKDGRRIPMGGATTMDSPITFHIKIPPQLKHHTRLIHNGVKIPLPNRATKSFSARQAGTYRVEVYLKETTPLHKNCPWIVSNPIFLKEKESE